MTLNKINALETARTAVKARVRLTELDEVQVVSGASLDPQPVQWLWPGWIALGKVHLLAGSPGQGKTTIVMSFAATVTVGGHWPDGTHCPAGNVLIWSGEDDPADTLLPRLIASEGDRTNVYFIEGTRVNGELRPFDPARDMKALKAKAESIGNVRLIIVDPIVSAVLGDGHKNTETRRALQPLVDLAADMSAALVGITHFGKGGQGGDPVQRVIGSVAFAAVARVVLVAAKVKSNEGNLDRRLLARGKSNIGPDGGGYEYKIEQTNVLGGIEATYISFGALVEGTARELLTDPDEQFSEDQSALDTACDFLREVLQDCPVCSKDVEAQAKEAGVSIRTVRRASDKLGIIKKPAADKRWYWRLPK